MASFLPQRKAKVFFQNVFLFIYLAVSGLSCDMCDLSLWCTGSVVAAVAPGHVGVLAPRPGNELTSPALAVRFLTSGPPDKSPESLK